MKTMEKTVLAYKDNSNYLIYNDGRVYSKCRNKFLTPYQHNKGYLYISLRVNGKLTTKQIGRLVAEVFIPNPENKPTTNHKNGIKNDNRVENLEWATYLENNRHSWEVLGRKYSEETKIKIGKASRGRKHSEEAKAKISIARIGMKFSKETRAKMSKAQSGRKLSEATKKKMSIAKIGNKNAIKITEPEKQNL